MIHFNDNMSSSDIKNKLLMQSFFLIFISSKDSPCYALEWQAMILQHLLDLKVAADRCHYHQNNIEMKT